MQNSILAPIIQTWKENTLLGLGFKCHNNVTEQVRRKSIKEGSCFSEMEARPEAMVLTGAEACRGCRGCGGDLASTWARLWWVPALAGALRLVITAARLGGVTRRPGPGSGRGGAPGRHVTGSARGRGGGGRGGATWRYLAACNGGCGRGAAGPPGLLLISEPLEIAFPRHLGIEKRIIWNSPPPPMLYRQCSVTMNVCWTYLDTHLFCHSSICCFPVCCFQFILDHHLLS